MKVMIVTRGSAVSDELVVVNVYLLEAQSCKKKRLLKGLHEVLNSKGSVYGNYALPESVFSLQLWCMATMLCQKVCPHHNI